MPFDEITRHCLNLNHFKPFLNHFERHNNMNIKNLLYLFIAVTTFFACAEDETGDPDLSIFPEITISDATVEEGAENKMAEFKVTLSGENKTNAIVSYSTISGSAIDTADFDYVISAGKLIFGPEDTEKIIQVEIAGDDKTEPDETFEILLFNPVNARLIDGQDRAIITIFDDDEPVEGAAACEAAIPTEGYTTPTSYDGMTLVWSDEFDGTALNEDNWTHEIGTGNNGWGNSELQYYRPENTSMQEGNLVICAKEETFGGSDYTSSRIITADKQTFQYGRIDIRAVLPEGKGLWPATWMLGSNFFSDGWPKCGEIDIMELVGHQPNRVYGTVHYGENVGEHQQRGGSKSLPAGLKYSDEYNVFSLVWKENEIRWLVNDQLYFLVSKNDIGDVYPFNNEFFFIFNVAVGGQWPGDPGPATVFPQQMIVDYVRVFQDNQWQ